MLFERGSHGRIDVSAADHDGVTRRHDVHPTISDIVQGDGIVALATPRRLGELPGFERVSA
ncbi:MAG TPA: hypothetical protein VL997_02260 [Dyella sp.]|nr:hypothetical protein [Dyella sp.]